MSTDSSSRNPVEKLAEEFVERRRQGETVTIEDYVHRFPRWAEQIRDLFPTLMAMERLGAETLDAEAGEAAHAPPRLERLGDYRILREVGRGGMGAVYEAEQESLARRVALKVMLPGALMDARYLARFEHEARAAARLHHTNIVPVFGVGHQAGVHYFVMQLIDGQGLDKVLVELRRLHRLDRVHGKASQAQSHLLSGGTRQPDRSQRAGAPSEVAAEDSASLTSPISSVSDSSIGYYRSVARLIVQAADALDYANTQGVLHRDVKPANLLLDGSGTLWVTDFGLAKAVGSDDLTHTGDIVGTLRYMAPERFDNHCTAQSDIYSLGLTLYELLTMQPAFDDSNRAALTARVMNDVPAAPRTIDSKIPRDLETITLKAIAREPDRRYAAAGEMAEDLRRFLEDRPIQARRIGALERSWRWCRRNPTVASLTTGVALLLIAVSFAYANTLEALAEAHTARASETRALTQSEQRAQAAEEAVELAARTVDEYFTTVSQSTLLDVPGLTPLRRELLTLALSHYQQLIERRAANNDKWELALAQARVGIINDFRGSRDVAIEHFEESLRLLAELRRDQPRAAKYFHQAAKYHRELGLLFRTNGQLGPAEAQLHAAVEAAEQGLVLEPANAHLSIGTAFAYAYRGYVRALRQKLAEGAEDCERAVQVLRRLRDRSPPLNLETSRELEKAFAVVFNLQGSTLAGDQRRNYTAAIEPYTEVVRYYRDLLESEPPTEFARCELARGLYNLGRVNLATQNVERALELFTESLAIRTELSYAYPAVEEYVSEVVNTHRRIALIYGRQNKTNEVEIQFRKAIQRQSELVRYFPKIVAYQRTLSDLWAGLAEEQRRAQRGEQASLSFAKAAEVGEQLLAAVVPSPENRRFVAQTCNNVGAWYRHAGDFDRARQLYRRAIAAADAIAASEGESTDYLLLIGMYHSNLGDVETATGNTDVAADVFDDAIGAYRRVLAAEPTHGRAKSLLYNAYRLRATALDYADRFDESVHSWAEARKLATGARVAYATQFHGFALSRSGDHRAAAAAAEYLLSEESWRPSGSNPAQACYHAAQVLAGAAQAAAQDQLLDEAERSRLAEQYAGRAVKLLSEAHTAGLYEAPKFLNGLLTSRLLDPLRERADYQQLNERVRQVDQM